MNTLIPLERSFASHKRAEFWSEKNGDVKPENVFKSSHKEYWFDCDKCKHSFDKALNSVVRGNWCPYCANKKLCEYSDCKECEKKSFVLHEKSKYLVSVDPRTIFMSCNKEFDFMCECGHAFTAALNNVSSGKWCPYCVNKKLCEYPDCKECEKKSFASHPKSKYIIGVDPRTIFRSSDSEFYFMCECGHTFPSTLNSVSSGHWCSYCSNPPRKLCTDQNCEQCFKNSFKSHPKSKYIVGVDPRTIFRSSDSKFDFKCECGHTFPSRLHNINKGHWCPHCKHKTEDILCTFLEQQYTSVQRQFSAHWCERKRFDVVVHDVHVIIELDGPQHFQQVSNWSSPEENKANDMYKMVCANENGYSVVRILQEDVLGDKYDWKTELTNVIREYPTPTNIFLCKNDEYSGHVIFSSE